MGPREARAIRIRRTLAGQFSSVTPSLPTRAVLELIKQGKPHPEKYRFFLFADKREVELAWNGKSFAVCTTMLSFQTRAHIDERRQEVARTGQGRGGFSWYEVSWIGYGRLCWLKAKVMWHEAATVS